jgi:hypothetical protein
MELVADISLLVSLLPHAGQISSVSGAATRTSPQRPHWLHAIS